MMAYESLISSHYLIENITLSIVIMALMFVFAVYFVNKLIYKRIWDNFFKTVQMIATYNVQQNSLIKPMETDITEFKELNQALEKMSNRILQDYRTLKEYTENVLHEIQTPLAIVKSKTELLLQDENISEQSLGTIKKIYDTAGKLSKINTHLALLAKIENNQFAALQPTHFTRLFNDALAQFEDFIASKHLKVSINNIGSHAPLMNPYLAETLVINLIKNAVGHNVVNGA
ncbi:MAG: HAMP domain-containing histidine kinase [Bacteroidales bacterium]|nr:HAMP domain-containing histidine kinase [Bacteroidales bacterium]